MPPLEPGDHAPDLTLADTHGAAVRLAELWTQRPLALFFVRHFGCPFCRQQMTHIRDDRERFEDAGGLIACITQGSVAQAAAFQERLQLPFLCLADPQREAYRAYGVAEGTLGQIYGPSVWAPGLQAVLKHGVGQPVGSRSQLHASFIIDSQGIVRFVHYPRHQAHHPSHAEMIRAVATLTGAPAA